MMSDSDLRQALLGTWRLISFQVDVDGTIVNQWGDDPLGYLVYTPDGHVLVQFAARERTILLGPSSHGPVLSETTEANTPLGFGGYSGTFAVHDGEVVHHTEFHVIPNLNGRVEARSVALDGDRLILRTPHGQRLEWQRVQAQ
jgi:Lipocalin-like domain